MKMMRPHRRARIPGSTAWVTRNAEVRLAFTVSFQSVSVTASIGRGAATPALLMTMSMPPSSR
jgi:hypothetical protein